MKKALLLSFILFTYNSNFAQPFVKETLKSNRDKLYRNLVNNSINKNLSLTLTDSTEENWQAAFQAMELLRFSSPWVHTRMAVAAEQLPVRSLPFQRAFLEAAYALYKNDFYDAVKFLLLQTTDSKIFAMCAAYIMAGNHAVEDAGFLAIKTKQQLALQLQNPVPEELLYDLTHAQVKFVAPDVSALLQKDYLSGNVLVISFQNADRDYSGLVFVRNAQGEFIRADSVNYFSVPQLARSLSGMPAYFSNGNTPQGIFRMDGFANSKSSFIGPTPNLQLTMPFEFKANHFFKDSTLSDSAWNIDLYKQLLPAALRNYFPMQQAYDAGRAGRTEIIAHGTTINPAYYLRQPYYPISPTQGCLCTKELWDDVTGKLAYSDQQKLADAVVVASGADGYLIVVNIIDEPRAVKVADVLPYFKKAGQ